MDVDVGSTLWMCVGEDQNQDKPDPDEKIKMMLISMDVDYNCGWIERGFVYMVPANTIDDFEIKYN